MARWIRKPPTRVTFENLTDEDLNSIISNIERENHLIDDPYPVLLWRKSYKWKNRASVVLPGDLHYYKQCPRFFGTNTGYWKNRTEGMYLYRKLVSQYICKLCILKKEQENKKISAYFLRLASGALLWTEQDVTEYEKREIDKKLGGDTNV